MASRFRYFQLDRAKADATSRMIPITFSSETAVARSDDEFGNYDEILSHDPQNVDLTRLKTNAPFLLGHDHKNPLMHVGTIEAPTIDNDKRGRAMVKMSRSQLGNEIFQDMLDGVRTHTSVGYEITGVVSNTVDSAGKRTVVFKWSPYEISAVNIPADLNATIGRSRARKIVKKNLTRSMVNDECCGLCYYAENNLVELLEEMESEADATDATAIAAVKEAIVSCSTAIKSFSYWSEKTAADTIEICRATAKTFQACIAAIEESDMDEDICDDTVESLQVAIDKMLKNAGGEEVVTTTTETQTRKENQPQLDNPTLLKRGEEEKPAEQPKNFMAEKIETPATPTTEDLRKAEMTRIREINATVELLVKDHPTATEKFRKLGTEACDKGMDVRDFKASMIAEIPGAKPAKEVTLSELTNGERGAEARYSVGRAIQSCLLNKSQFPDGLEGGVHQEMVKRGLVAKGASGFQVPFDAMISRGTSRKQKRDLNVNTFGQGGAFVQTSVMTPIIELLRNRMVCDRLGVQGMAGLEGNVAIPRQTGAATAYSLPEQSTLTKSTQALDQIVLTPHRVGAYNSYSRQLLLQSSVDVENFLRDDLMKVIAIKWDYLILQGQGGGSEPTGILNTTGIGSLIFGGTATWAQVVAFETALSLANADLGNMAYVTSPGVRGRWKAVAKTGIGVTSVVPIFLWEKGAWADGSNDGEINGYRGAATNQILNNLVFFGNWEDTIHALWGGYDVIVDPYTQATDGTNRVTVNTFGDVAVRHAASYCVSQDAGNQ